MPEYPPNYHGYKEEQKAKKEKKIEKVISGTVRTQKKSELRKVVYIFISDVIHSVKNYIFDDVLVPAIKKAIDDIVSNGIHMLLYNGDKRCSSRSTVSKVSYGGYFKSPNSQTELKANSVRSGFDYDTILFDNRGEAEAVLSAMDDIIDQYGIVSVLDMYDLAGYTTTNYAAQRYGWTDIHTASVARVSDGYVIRLPRAMPIN